MKRLLLALLCVFWPIFASASSLEEAEAALRRGQTDAALSFAQSHRPTDGAETIRRLWVLGVAYNRQNRPRAAIDPLNRLVALAPAQSEFRLELALSLIRAGQSERARYHLGLAQGADLAPAVRARVESEIDTIDKSRNWQGYIRFAIAPESNAARRTAAEIISLGGFTFRLVPGARAQPATGVELGFGLAAMPRLSDDLRARLSVDASTRLFRGRAPDDLTLRAGAALLHFGDRGRQLSAEVFTSRRWLDNQHYSQSLGVEFRHSRLIGNRANLTVSAQRERLHYRQPAYIVDRTAVGLQFVHATTAQLQLHASARAEVRHSQNQLAAGHAIGVTIGGQYSFTGGLRAGLTLSQDYNTFPGLHPLFGVRRTDRKSAATLQINNQNWSRFGFSPVLKIAYERQHSSIVVNSYSNLSASVSLTRAF
ncbi:surface lipoprotein assembly modifier [Roseicitreum antarcticum]|uniref:Surface lipoprotein assembly modifier C-terminal domain-containing protein n=1 Tax=Roseicitreum antarcticum TaxID=564137 RepID=A0A1H2VEL7_9RHOB|nr:surface lipoprotein assembly modifier [Roseicitreum antarcticum]SDW66319.1 Protein of unknown function [Roseicitreum antarcticum]